MIRRTTQRSSAKNSSLPYASSSPTKYNGKKKERKTTPVQVLIFALICLGSLGVLLLTPSQKHELAQAEHKMEEWVHKELHNNNNNNNNNNNEYNKNPKPRKTHVDEEPQKAVQHHALADLHPEEHPEQAEEWEQEYLHPHQEAHSDEQETHDDEASSSDNKPPPSRWVDGEKALKQKLKVLFDQQAKGENLAAPVLTRYLGETIPAFVGTPESSMTEEEWKKLIDQKYQEMREEEEAWQKKMAAFIQSQGRDMGITTP